MSTLFSDISLGLSVAASVGGLLYCFLGVFLGTFIGVLPGIGIMATLAMLMPITYHIDPNYALIMLGGIYYGASYGGSTASILMNLPGTATSAVTGLDGYPMAKQGRGGQALFMTAIASFVGQPLRCGPAGGLLGAAVARGAQVRAAGIRGAHGARADCGLRHRLGADRAIACLGVAGAGPGVDRA